MSAESILKNLFGTDSPNVRTVPAPKNHGNWPRSVVFVECTSALIAERGQCQDRHNV